MPKSDQPTLPRYARRDAYGGCPNLSFEATGFFRTEQADRWWLVTPLGSAFLSFGLNHANPGLLRRAENRAFWAEHFGLPEDAGPAAWLPPFQDKLRRDLRLFGFNTLGCHTETSHIAPGTAPYICTLRFVDICHWMTPTEADFLDVFDDAFRRHCEGLAHTIAGPLRDDPYLIGYSFTDCPVLTDLDAAPRGVVTYGAPRVGLPTWPRVLRNLGGEAPGKQAYVACLRELYGDDIQAFNRTYDAAFDSFDALCRAVGWRLEVDPENAGEQRDNARFLEQIVDRYYTIAIDALRSVDPHHLILGDKLNGNTGVPDEIVRVVGRHVGALFYQFYATFADQEPLLDRWPALADVPLFNGDSSYSVPNERMPHPNGPHCANQEERARVSDAFARRAFARAEFVGWNWCGWMDSWKTYPGQEARQHSGLQDPFGRHYRPMVETFSRFSAEMYDVAAGHR